jgi:hypothetical protein
MVSGCTSAEGIKLQEIWKKRGLLFPVNLMTRCLTCSTSAAKLTPDILKVLYLSVGMKAVSISLSCASQFLQPEWHARTRDGSALRIKTSLKDQTLEVSVGTEFKLIPFCFWRLFLLQQLLWKSVVEFLVSSFGKFFSGYFLFASWPVVMEFRTFSSPDE